jgi:hypothetical protein
MPIRRRNLSRRQHLDSDAQAWLDGRECHFFQFKPDDELAAIWQEHGDSETMYWTRGMSLPITLEELKANESAWLNSGEHDEYGMQSFFIGKHPATMKSKRSGMNEATRSAFTGGPE